MRLRSSQIVVAWFPSYEHSLTSYRIRPNKSRIYFNSGNISPGRPVYCSMRVFLPYFIAFIFALNVSVVYSASHHYPLNPHIDSEAIYISYNGVSRINRATMEVDWQALAGVHTFEPVVTRNRVLVGSVGGIYALDRVSGAIAWHFSSQSPLFSPAVSEGIAFVGGQDGSLRALEVATRRLVWKRHFDGWIYPPAILGERLVVGGNSGLLHGISTRSGETIWSVALTQELVYRPVEVSPDEALVTTYAGDTIVISALDGSTIWATNDAGPSFPPALADGRIYTGAFDGTLRARRVGDGRPVWMLKLQGRLAFLPQVADGVIMIGSDHGRVAAINAVTGELLWQRNARKTFIASPVVIDGKVTLFSSGGAITQWSDRAVMVTQQP